MQRVLASGLALVLLLLAAPPESDAVFEPKVMGGVVASISEVPWTVFVETPSGSCTGTIIAPRWVLTAAHCFSSTSSTGVYVGIGSDRFDAGFPEIRTATRVVRHPDWNPVNMRGDLALVQLDAATNAPAIRLAAASASDPVGAMALITGWGMLDATRETNRLMRATVPVLPDIECSLLYGPDYHASTMVCAGGQGIDVCAGDSGGPLATGQGTDRTQIGVVSYGEECSPFSSTIGVYTSVAAFRTWIDSTIGVTPPPAPGIFTDVNASNPHAASITAVAEAGIAGGYPDGTYRPDAPVTRAQMATFLLRAAELTDPGGSSFSDVPSTHPHAPGIRAVAAAGIAGGYPDGTYRPAANVTRAQMATFLQRAANLAQGTLPAPFSDVPNANTHARAIAAVAEAGIAGGYPDGTYRPDRSVTRGQMATFLTRAFLDVTPPPLPPPPPPAPSPDLSSLVQACTGWDPAACDELYRQAAPGSAEQRFGDTCGDRIPANTGLWCVDALGHPLTRPCYEGDMWACDDLYLLSPIGSFDELIGDTCAFRQPAGTGRWCVDVFG